MPKCDKNAGGDVVARFPAAGTGCRVDARASYGVVESEMPRVIVQDDGKSAVGAIGNATRPWVRIEAEGNIRILGGSSAPPPPAAGSEE